MFMCLYGCFLPPKHVLVDGTGPPNFVCARCLGFPCCPIQDVFLPYPGYPPDTFDK